MRRIEIPNPTSTQGGKSNIESVKRTNKPNDSKRETIYVYPRFGSEFIINSEPKDGKYSKSAEITPVYGTFYNAKAKKAFKASELRDKRVIVNLPKDLDVKKGDRVLWGEPDSFVVVSIKKEVSQNG